MVRKTLGIFSICILVAGLLSGLYITQGTEGEINNPNQITENKSKSIAKNFLENSPTYKFDGYNLKCIENIQPETDNCKKCWTFLFEYTSKHAGYGNRSGKMVAQVITPHEVRITVENGEVTSATLDQKWDVINQKMLET